MDISDIFTFYYSYLNIQINEEVLLAIIKLQNENKSVNIKNIQLIMEENNQQEKIVHLSDKSRPEGVSFHEADNFSDVDDYQNNSSSDLHSPISHEMIEIKAIESEPLDLRSKLLSNQNKPPTNLEILSQPKQVHPKDPRININDVDPFFAVTPIRLEKQHKPTNHPLNLRNVPRTSTLNVQTHSYIDPIMVGGSMSPIKEDINVINRPSNVEIDKPKFNDLQLFTPITDSICQSSNQTNDVHPPLNSSVLVDDFTIIGNSPDMNNDNHKPDVTPILMEDYDVSTPDSNTTNIQHTPDSKLSIETTTPKKKIFSQSALSPKLSESQSAIPIDSQLLYSSVTETEGGTVPKNVSKKNIHIKSQVHSMRTSQTFQPTPILQNSSKLSSSGSGLRSSNISLSPNLEDRSIDPIDEDMIHSLIKADDTLPKQTSISNNNSENPPNTPPQNPNNPQEEHNSFRDSEL